jgi:hypothetical protein
MQNQMRGAVFRERWVRRSNNTQNYQDCARRQSDLVTDGWLHIGSAQLSSAQLSSAQLSCACLIDFVEAFFRTRERVPAHVPAKHALGLDPRVESGSPRRTVVRQGEPLFADKDMRLHWNLRRFPFIWDHQVIPFEREAL